MPPQRLGTGIEGLDEILGGGLTADRLYLVEGTPGTGKTTLALQFLMEGVRAGESGLYVTLSETLDELTAVAESHGWSLDGIHVVELVPEYEPELEQSLLHPSEIELGETVRGVMDHFEARAPRRLVIDSLSELRLLAQNPLRYRRQILALKQFFSTRACTVILLDDRTSQPGDLQLHSIAHGVISLEQSATGFGAERRRLQIIKMRGISYSGGYHDFAIRYGGMQVFSRIVAAPDVDRYEHRRLGTGVEALDNLLGGGLVAGTTTLLNGPAGVGKTTVAVQCLCSGMRQGLRGALFLFDERLPTLIARTTDLGMDLRPFIANGQLSIRQVDPAELSPGEFASWVRTAVDRDGVGMVLVDSLNAYLQAMPEERHLTLQMHELLSFLAQRNVITLMVLGQHGLVGDVRSDVDLSYLADSVLLLRFFESDGEVHKAISTIKTRTTNHERTIREFAVDGQGLQVGEPLRQFSGVLTGVPEYRGDGKPLLAMNRVAAAHAMGEAGAGGSDE